MYIRFETMFFTMTYKVPIGREMFGQMRPNDKMRRNYKKWFNDAAFVWQFALDDFKGRYAGSLLGGLWAFLQPTITILLYWFVFQMGFRSQPVKNFPFILWLIAGLIPWFFISDSIMAATGCLLEYSYLVKKVLFNINILPLAKALSGFIVHLALIVFILLCFAINGYFPTVYYFQLLPGIAYTFLLVVGFAYITATLYVFFKDTIQVGAMPAGLQGILKYNIFYYIISCFRNALITREWFFPGYGMLAYYWGMCAIVLTGGIWMFDRCRQHFADVL